MIPGGGYGYGRSLASHGYGYGIVITPPNNFGPWPDPDDKGWKGQRMVGSHSRQVRGYQRMRGRR